MTNMTLNNSLHRVNTVQGTLDQAKLFGITTTEAKSMRLAYLTSAITDFEIRIKNLRLFIDQEPSEAGKSILLDALKRHTFTLDKFKREYNDWQKPVKQYNAQQAPLDWSKASLYPCADLLGNPAKKIGKEWIYNAPHREDKNPSFSVNIEKNIWHDWGSGQGGNVFDLYILLNGGTKVQACKALLGL